MRMLVLTMDLCGTFAFALGGAMQAVRRRLDVFGVLVVAFVASSFGGIFRDPHKRGSQSFRTLVSCTMVSSIRA